MVEIWAHVNDIRSPPFYCSPRRSNSYSLLEVEVELLRLAQAGRRLVVVRTRRAVCRIGAEQRVATRAEDTGWETPKLTGWDQAQW